MKSHPDFPAGDKGDSMEGQSLSKQLIVIGGGAAGMMAALSAASKGVSVTLLERNPKLGRKLYITGKGLDKIPTALRYISSVLSS